MYDTVSSTRTALSKAVRGEDDRIVVIVGPTATHECKATMEFAQKLSAMAESLKAELIDHITSINAEYPGGGISKGLQKEKVKPQGNLNPAPKHRSQEQFFKNRDRNGDGEVTLEEYIGNPKGRNVPALTKRFKKIDSNGDGKLRLDELKK